MKILYIVGAVATASLLSYAGFSYHGQKQLAVQLNQLLDDTLKEKEQLQISLEQMQTQLKEKEDRLAGLADVEGIKTALINAQANISNLNKDLERFNRDRAALQEANISLTTRLNNTTKEYMRSIDELKTAQDLVAKLNKGLSPDKKKLDDAFKSVEDKNKELAQQKQELDSLKASSDSLIASNKALEKKLKDLESARGSLVQNVDNLQQELGDREAPAKKLQDTIASLRRELSRKEEQIADLENKLAGQAVSPAKASAASSDKRSGELKGEMDRLSGILIRKEFEIDSAKKEALAAKEELVALQSKLAGVQDNLYSSRVNQEKLKELENQRIFLQAQLNQVQQDLSKKKELVDSLQKNIDYLSNQVDKKDREKASLDARLSLLDASSRQDIEKEKKRSQESDMMYNSLKSQLSQFSDEISLKEAEIENNRKEVAGLKEELSDLRVKAAQLETELLESREGQKRIMGDLQAAVRLNAVLQERIKYAPAGQETGYPVSSPEDKKKADELKRRIEVILEPDKQR
jgi:chromosome segregation ATPase